MTFEEFEALLATSGCEIGSTTASGHAYLTIKKLRIAGGTHSGQECTVGIKRSAENPWIPEAAVHVTPHLVTMGERNSQASPLGTEWQYLSRRFDRPLTAKAFKAHILTVLAEL